MNKNITKKLIIFCLVALVIGAGTATGIGKRLGNTEVKDIVRTDDLRIPEISYDHSVFQGAQIVPGEVIVQFASSVSTDQFQVNKGLIRTGISSLDAINTRYQIKGMQKVFQTANKNDCFGLPQFYKITLPKNSDVFSLINEYQKNPLVVSAEPNYLFQAYDIPNDPYYSSSGSWNQSYPDMWGLKKISAENAWNITTGSDDVVVAVVDTGVDYNHPDIAANMWINPDEIPNNGIDDDQDGFVDNMYGADFAYTDGNPMDGHGHGTHCAGIIAAVGNNGLGVVGVNWQCQIMAVKGLDNNGYGTSTGLAQALCWAADNGADVISNSWGSLGRHPYDPMIEQAVRYAYSQGCVLVFAAGNNNDDVRYYCPTNMDEVITVAATDPYDHKASFSNWGEHVDVCAPGVDILSLRANGTDFYKNGIHIVGQQYYRSDGTSMACPHVAGLAALLLSKNHSMTQAMIKTIITNTGDPVDSLVPIGRRINATAALLREPAAAILQSIPRWTDVQGTIMINGSASGALFQYYTVEYQLSESASPWVELVNSTTQVEDGTVAVIDTTMLPEGEYRIRLQVVCSDTAYEDQIKIVVNNVFNQFIVDDDNTAGPWDGTSIHPFLSVDQGVTYAGDRDQVFVRIGTYYDHVMIDRSITLNGEYAPMTKVFGLNSSVDVFDVGADDVSIRSFTIQNAKNGVSFLYMMNETVQGNIFINNYNAILFETCGYSAVVDNLISGTTNIDIGFGYWCSGCVVSGNTISGGKCGVYLYEYNWDNMISDNNIQNNIDSICVIESSDTLVANNHIENCTGRCISLGGSLSNFTIIGNTMVNHNQLGTGIQLYEVTNSTVTDNTFIGFFNSIFSYANCANNRYIHNNFLNYAHVYDLDLGTNFWDDGYPSGGNYWSGYSGVDADRDGIGDTAQVVPNGNQDRYPFMSQNGWLNSPPTTPSQPIGPIKGLTGTSSIYNTSTTDHEGNNVSYLWDWGDGNSSGWFGPYLSGQTISTSHTWFARGINEVKVKARDARGAESNWSAPLTVKIYKLGDVNNDGWVTFADIDPFVAALGTTEAQFQVQHPSWTWLAADCNQDGRITFADIDPFVALIGT